MKSLIPKPVSKSKSQVASSTTQKSKTSTTGFRDSRPEAIQQRKMQEAANTSPQVMQLQAIQAMADSHVLPASSKPVIQRIKGLKKDKVSTTYSEVENENEENVKVGRFGRKRKTLVEDNLEGAGTTTETGYQVLTLEEGEKQDSWEIMTSVLEWNNNTLCTRNKFNLPVSCIDSSEHVMHHHHENENNKNKKRKKEEDIIPDYDPEKEIELELERKRNEKNKTKQEEKDGKKVGLYFGKKKMVKIKNSEKKKPTIENTYVANISTEEIGGLESKWTDYDFTNKPAKVGEGLFVQNRAEGSIFHAVAVVGRKKSGQLIVLERNAGKTTGRNMYIDNKWLVNVYANEGAFKKSMGENKDWRIGKLKVL